MNLIGYHAKIAELYADDRLRDRDRIRDGVPALAHAFAWITYCDPLEVPAGRRLRELLGSNDAVRRAVRNDLPLYKPPTTNYGQWSKCEAPMVRRDGLCGKNPQWGYRHIYVKTGQWRNAGFCSRHRAEGQAQREENRADVAANEVPDPVPNSGGILPGLFPMWEWERLYVHVAPSWTYPTYGIVADHWPQVVELRATGAPKLTVIFNGEEMPEPAELPTPVLRLVGADPRIAEVPS